MKDQYGLKALTAAYAEPISKPLRFTTLYQTVCDFGFYFGIGNGGDCTTSFPDAVDQIAERIAEDPENGWRAFRMDFDVETGALETCREINDEVLAELAKRAKK